MDSPEKSRVMRLGHSQSHPNLLQEVQTPKRATNASLMSPLEVDLNFSLSNKHPRLTLSVSAHLILLLDLVPELLASNLIDNFSLVTPARPSSYNNITSSTNHQRGLSFTFFTPLHSASSSTTSFSNTITTSATSTTPSSRSARRLRNKHYRLNSGINPFYNPSSLVSPTNSSFNETSPFKLSLDKPNPSSDTLVDFYKLIPDSSSFHSSLDFLDTLSIDDVNPAEEKHEENTFVENSLEDSNPGNNQLLFNSDSFNSDIFLQAADLTLKMVSQSKPPSLSPTIGPNLLDHQNNFLNHLQQPSRIIRSEGSNNLASFVNSCPPSAKSNESGYESHSNLIHSHSQPQSLSFNSFNGIANQIHTSLSAKLLTPSLDSHTNLTPNGIPTNMIPLPEGLDHTKLILKKSKRGRKSIPDTNILDEKKPKKNHECPLCGSRFQRPEHVKRHMRSHSSEKPFHCDQPNCGKRFNRSDNLKAHLRKIHKLQI